MYEISNSVRPIATKFATYVALAESTGIIFFNYIIGHLIERRDLMICQCNS